MCGKNRTVTAPDQFSGVEQGPAVEHKSNHGGSDGEELLMPFSRKPSQGGKDVDPSNLFGFPFSDVQSAIDASEETGFVLLLLWLLPVTEMGFVTGGKREHTPNQWLDPLPTWAGQPEGRGVSAMKDTSLLSKVGMLLLLIMLVSPLIYAAVEEVGPRPIIFVPDHYPSIQAAIGSATTIDGDLILVRPGTYGESIDFGSKKIKLRSVQGPAVTTIDASGLGTSAVLIFGGQKRETELKGFTIKNGIGLYQQYVLGRSGGGMYIGGASSPKILDNIFVSNTADWGGAIHVINHSDALIKGNKIHLNEAVYLGGGIYIDNCSPTVEENQIFSNTSGTHGDPNQAGGGGGIFSIGEWAQASPQILANEVYDNQAFKPGGGICCQGVGEPVIKKNLVKTNVSVTGRGGGIYCNGSQEYGYLTPWILDNVILSNRAATYGGGIACDRWSRNLAIVGNVVAWNQSLGTSANEGGGGIWINQASGVFTHNTFYGNDAQVGSGFYYQGTGTPQINNCIVWANTGAQNQLDIQYGYGNVSYSDVAVAGGGVYQGQSNINTDPLLFDPQNLDFHLTFDSPCRNSGTNFPLYNPAEDIEGDPRKSDYMVNGVDKVQDMGADEFHLHLYHLGTVTPGQMIDVRVVGWPGFDPVTLLHGSYVLNQPISTVHGLLYLPQPFLDSSYLGPIPSNGILSVTVTVPSTWSSGQAEPYQALVGPMYGPDSLLTNLMILAVP